MPPPSRPEVRVLYVEDAFDQALLVQAFFNTIEGSSVTHAQDGDQAVRLIETEEWDLLVTDLNLPGTDGFAVIRKMRAKYADAPILVTTGYTQPQYEEQSLRAGADHVMIKPLSKSDFIARVRDLIERDAVPEVQAGETVIVLEGRLGDAEMGCGGTMILATEADASVVIIPILGTEDDETRPALKGAAMSADLLGAEIRVDRTLFGSLEGQRDLLVRTLDDLRPTRLYVPAPDDRDPARGRASEIGRRAAGEVGTVFGYETATTGLDFAPTHFVDVHAQMVQKMEALASYQSMGASRIDLRPRMAQAYARYWGRFRDFTEVEAFERVKKG